MAQKTLYRRCTLCQHEFKVRLDAEAGQADWRQSWEALQVAAVKHLRDGGCLGPVSDVEEREEP